MGSVLMIWQYIFLHRYKHYNIGYRIMLSVRNSRQQLSEKYQITQQILGKGAFGSVAIGIQKSTNAKVAVKIIPKQYQHVAKNEATVYEALQKYMAQCEGGEEKGHLLKYHGAYLAGNQIAIVTEIFGESLSEYLHQFNSISLQKSLEIMLEAIMALKPYHQLGILHRDLKPSNILIAQEKDRNSVSIKLCDPGLAHIKEKRNKDIFLKRVGTIAFESPETIILNQYSECSDIWSLGIVFYIYGKFPYSKQIYDDAKLLAEQAYSNPIKFKNIPQEISHIGQMCLNIKPHKRASLDALLGLIRAELQKKREGNEKQVFQKQEEKQFSKRKLSLNTTGSEKQGRSKTRNNQDFLFILLKKANEKLITMPRNSPLPKHFGAYLSELLNNDATTENDQCLSEMRKRIKKSLILCEYTNTEADISLYRSQFITLDILFNAYLFLKALSQNREQNEGFSSITEEKTTKELLALKGRILKEFSK